jgi:hypothetical protein
MENKEKEKPLAYNTNGLLKRYIALSAVKSANIWTFVLILVPVILYIVSGLKVLNISNESIVNIFLLAQMAIGFIQNRANQVINFYFERDKEELNDKK